MTGLADSMWVEAARDTASEARERALALARVRCASLWPFLSAAASVAEYQQRLTLTAERLEAACDEVAPGDQDLVGQLVAGLDADFLVLHRGREARHEAARQVAAELARRRPTPTPPPAGPSASAARALRDRLAEGRSLQRRALDDQQAPQPEQEVADVVEEPAPEPLAMGAPRLGYGNGTDHVDCPECGGTGSGPAGGWEPASERHGGPVTCPLCHGETTVPASEAHAWRTSSVRHTAPGGGEHAPYKLEEGDGGWYVVNAKGERKNEEPKSREAAVALQRALYANVPGASDHHSSPATCRKCVRGRTPDLQSCGYCLGRGSLDLTTAAIQAADGWDQGLVRLTAEGAVQFDPDAAGSERWQKLAPVPTPPWIVDEWGTPPLVPGVTPAVNPADGRELASTRAANRKEANPYLDDNPYRERGPGMPGSAESPGEATLPQHAGDVPSEVVAPPEAGAADTMLGEAQPEPAPERTPESFGRPPDVVSRLAARVLAANPAVGADSARRVALATLRRFPAVRAGR